MNVLPPPPPLGDQLDGQPADPVDWTDVVRRLRLRPEEASLYCHSFEPSPLHVALSKTNPPPSLEVVTAFLEAYPDAAHHGDGNDATALHVAASNPSPTTDDDDGGGGHIASALLRENPSAAAQRTRSGGLLPLHRARRVRDVRSLVAAHPDAVVARDSRGRLPLHYLAEEGEGGGGGLSSAPLESFRIMVDASIGLGGGVGGVTSRDRKGRTPLMIAAERFERETTRRRSREEAEEAADGAESATAAAMTEADDDASIDTFDDDVEDEEEADYERLWETVEFMIRVAADDNYRPGEDGIPIEAQSAADGGGKGSEGDLENGTIHASRSADGSLSNGSATPPPRRQTFRPVHAAVELGCPPSVVSRFLSARPNQVYERDSRGRTPLAVAALRRSSSVEALSVLIKGGPTAARVMDTSGKLPIDLAAENGRDFHEGFEELIMAAPQAVETRAVGSFMYPFMSAAVGDGESSTSSSLNAVYGLLRAAPGVMEHFVSSGDE